MSFRVTHLGLEARIIARAWINGGRRQRKRSGRGINRRRGDKAGEISSEKKKKGGGEKKEKRGKYNARTAPQEVITARVNPLERERKLQH